MRLGIMEMQMDRLISFESGAESAVDQILNFDRRKLVMGLAQQGFPLIELGGDLGLFFRSAYKEKTIRQLAQIKDELDLDFTVHLPLWSVEPSTPLEPVRLGSTDAIIDIMDAVQPLEPEVYVLHATGALAAEFYRMQLPQVARSLILKQFQGGAISSIRDILEETGIPSRKLAIETIEFPLELTLEIADLLDLSVCLDTGHVLAGFSGAVEFEDALEACLPRLAEVHLHDAPNFMKTGNLGYGQDHQALGTQDLDVKQLMTRLTKHDFKGPIIFELSVKEAQKSMAYLQHLGVSA